MRRGLVVIPRFLRFLITNARTFPRHRLGRNQIIFFEGQQGESIPPDSLFHSIMAPNGPHNEEKFFTSFDLFYIAKLSTAPQESATLTNYTCRVTHNICPVERHATPHAYAHFKRATAHEHTCHRPPARRSRAGMCRRPDSGPTD